MVTLLMGIACIAGRTLADSSVCTWMAVGILATRRVWALAWVLTVVVNAGLGEGTVSVLLTFTHLDCDEEESFADYRKPRKVNMMGGSQTYWDYTLCRGLRSDQGDICT